MATSTKKKKDSQSEEVRKMYGRRDLLKGIALAGLGAGVAGLLSGMKISEAAVNTTKPAIVSQFSQIGDASVVVFQDSNGVNYAIDKAGVTGQVGKIIASGTDAASVIQQVHDILPVGGKIFLNEGTYNISQTINITKAIHIEGNSGEYVDITKPYSGTRLKATASISNIISWTASNPEGGTLTNILLDGNSLASTGLYVLTSIFFAEKVTIINCLDWGLADDGVHTHNYINCVFDKNGTRANPNPNGGGLKIGQITANGYPLSNGLFVNCDIEVNNGEGIHINSSNGLTFLNVVSESNQYASINASNSNQLKLISFWDENNMLASLPSGFTSRFSNCNGLTIMNPIFSPPSGMATDTIVINDSDAYILDPKPYTPNYMYGFYNLSSGRSALIIGNLDPSRVFISGTTTWSQVRLIKLGSVQGFNITTPAMPASGTAVANNNPFPVIVYLYGGTVTQITINGQVVFSSGTGISLTGQSFTLNPGDTIAITYTAAPTWKWYGL